MPNRFVFPLITLFWVCMNVLLWRSEFGGVAEFGSSIPVKVVWEKILTAPDDSTLEIMQGVRKAGYCRWRPNVGEELNTGKVGTEDYELEGMVKQLSGYRIDVEGSLIFEEASERLRFDLAGVFATNKVWKEVSARIAVRQNVWEIDARSEEEKLRIISGTGDGKWEKNLSFGDLGNPAGILAELGLPMLPLILNQWGFSDTTSQLSLGLQWEARNDWFAIGHSRIRVYRVQAKLLDRYKIVAIVSRVGEILRIELPNQLVLLNDAFLGI